VPSEAWCSGLTCSPVKAEIAGSNPVASASALKCGYVTLPPELREMLSSAAQRDLRQRKLSPTAVQQVTELASGGASLRAIAAQFQVSHETIRACLAAS
jgi:DNA-binding NarL/FixJ family response regulator